jgi:hypothetical protein
MKKVENLLNNSSLTRPSGTMDQRVEDLFDQARAHAQPHWFAFQVPAWGALAACVVCLFIGRLWVHEPEIQQATNPPPPVIVPENPPSPALTAESEPEVYVQITRNASSPDSSPFFRTQKSSGKRFSTSWSVTQ